MRAHIGGGWNVTHLTDHCIELRKDDFAYRKITGGRDGFVRVHAEKGMDRNLLIERALIQAKRCDGELALKVAADVIPSARALQEYRHKAHRLEASSHSGEASSLIGVKRV